LPIAVESFDLSEYDLVISSSSAFAKGVVTKPKTKHICYCHTPMRFAWDYYHNYKKERSELYGFRGMLPKMFLHYIRMWDRHCEARVDCFIANSEHTKKRIEKFYRRNADVIYPPVYVGGFGRVVGTRISRENLVGEYFLIVSQLRKYKRVDLAIDAFNKLELPLVIIGAGPERRKLEKIAGPNIKFLGWQEDEDVRRYYSECKALIFPGEEDFGITAVEAMSFGKPVLAFRKGGLMESVVEGVTGEFFDDLNPAVLADGVRRLLENYDNYNSDIIRQRAEEFSEKKFRDKIIQIIERNSDNA
jgi:glycosyltransferase involved in cell wall biosynthesis